MHACAVVLNPVTETITDSLETGRFIWPRVVRQNLKERTLETEYFGAQTRFGKCGRNMDRYPEEQEQEE